MVGAPIVTKLTPEMFCTGTGGLGFLFSSPDGVAVTWRFVFVDRHEGTLCPICTPC